jgi:alkyl hydroperoxide reductase subunit D
MKVATHPFVEFLPGYAEDVKTNLAAVLEPDSPGLTERQTLGIALAAAYATRHPETAQWAGAIVKDRLSAEEVRAAKVAATLMAMNNVYYRFIEFLGDPEYKAMPTRLKMTGLASHGIDKAAFEMMLLAASTVNGCAYCVGVHARKLIQAGLTKEAVQSVGRIAGVVSAAAQSSFISNFE